MCSSFLLASSWVMQVFIHWQLSLQ
uniref:Uncharacterized protein n=1 Tax=Rhizophora mucronata TaxID=61149 RepID=A0A2P2PUK6_RHIMU